MQVRVLSPVISISQRGYGYGLEGSGGGGMIGVMGEGGTRGSMKLKEPQAKIKNWAELLATGGAYESKCWAFLGLI